MSILELYADALDAVFGLSKKPDCPVCGYKLPQPHNHCDGCESPFDTQRCPAPGCTAQLCQKCMREHSWFHV